MSRYYVSRVAWLSALLSRVAAQRVICWDFDDDDPDAVGVLDPHLDQAPGLLSWFPEDADSRSGEAIVLGPDIPARASPLRLTGRTPFGVSARLPLAVTAALGCRRRKIRKTS